MLCTYVQKREGGKKEGKKGNIYIYINHSTVLYVEEQRCLGETGQAFMRCVRCMSG